MVRLFFCFVGLLIVPLYHPSFAQPIAQKRANFEQSVQIYLNIYLSNNLKTVHQSFRPFK